MKALLAIESSGKHGSIAIASLSEQTNGNHAFVPKMETADLPTDRGSAQSLADTINSLLSATKRTPADLGCLAVLNGPGSFTGLRVGIATAKAMAYALSIPIVELDTLDCIYYQTVESLRSFRQSHILLDAYRGQLFVKTRRSGSDTASTTLCDIENFVQKVIANGPVHEQAFVGPGCDRLQRFLAREANQDSIKAWFEPAIWLNDIDAIPHAKSVASLGWEKWRKGKCTDPFSLLPMYFRGSAAEEKLAKDL